MIEPILPAALLARSGGVKGDALLDAAAAARRRRVGLDVERAGAILASDEYAAEVRTV